jgi:hypothetical protein
MRSIGAEAFRGLAYLRQVVLRGADIVEIGDYAFAGCAALTTIEISLNLVYLGEGAFINSGLRQFRLGGATAVDTVTIGTQVAHIGADCFRNTSVRRVIFQSRTAEDPALTHMGAYAFGDIRSLESVTVRTDSIRFIGAFAFAHSNPNRNKSLRTLSLGEGLHEIRQSAFDSSYSLRGTLTLPASLKRIENAAFHQAFCRDVSSNIVFQPASELEFLGDWVFAGNTFQTRIILTRDGALTIHGLPFFQTSITTVAFTGSTAPTLTTPRTSYLLTGENAKIEVASETAKTAFTMAWGDLDPAYNRAALISQIVVI